MHYHKEAVGQKVMCIIRISDISCVIIMAKKVYLQQVPHDGAGYLCKDI